MNPGDISVEEAEESMRLYAREVIPAASAIEPAAFTPEELEPLEPTINPMIAAP